MRRFWIANNMHTGRSASDQPGKLMRVLRSGEGAIFQAVDKSAAVIYRDEQRAVAPAADT
jgi:hypothetical protein